MIDFYLQIIQKRPAGAEIVCENNCENKTFFFYQLLLCGLGQGDRVWGGWGSEGAPITTPCGPKNLNPFSISC